MISFITKRKLFIYIYAHIICIYCSVLNFIRRILKKKYLSNLADNTIQIGRAQVMIFIYATRDYIDEDD